MFDGGGPEAFLARLWSLVMLAIVGSFAAQLVMAYVVPLIPYILGGCALLLAGYVLSRWFTHRDRW